MFYTDVAKVDQDVVYVAMVVHICCKSMSPMFHLFFKRMLQACLFECCICFHTYVASVFIWMLCMFCNGFQVFFTNVSDTCFKYFICLSICCKCCIRMFSKVDLSVAHGLHMESWRGREQSPCVVYCSHGHPFGHLHASSALSIITL
jgi:hypothetical protein